MSGPNERIKKQINAISREIALISGSRSELERIRNTTIDNLKRLRDGILEKDYINTIESIGASLDDHNRTLDALQVSLDALSGAIDGEATR